MKASSTSNSRGVGIGVGSGGNPTSSTSSRALSGLSTLTPRYPNSSSNSSSSNAGPVRAPINNMSSSDQMSLNRQTGGSRKTGGGRNENLPIIIDEDNVEMVLKLVFFEREEILMNNINSKQAIYESQGLVIVQESLRNVKSLNENLVTSIEAVFGKAGVEMEKYIRTMNYWYIYQEFSGLYPFPKWCGQRLLEDGISEDQKTFPLQFGEQLIDFICGEDDEDLLNEAELPENQIPSTTSLFLGVCSSKLARIAFRYFLVFRHVTRKGVEDMGITLQNKTTGEKKEVENAKKVMLPWLKHVVGESLLYQVDGGIKNNLLDPMFKDKNSNLYRLYLSVTYSLKTYLHSTAAILESLQGGGIDKGYFGINPQDRAKLISESPQENPIIQADGNVAIIGYNASGAAPDPIIPLPTYSKWFYDFKIKDLLTQAALDARTQGIQFLMESVGSQLRRFQLPVDDDGEPHIFVDMITPTYFASLQMSQYSNDHFMSVGYGLKFHHIMGIGCLMSKDKNGCAPFVLPEAAKEAFMVKKYYNTKEDQDEGIESGRSVILKKAAKCLWEAHVSKLTGEELIYATNFPEMQRYSIEFGPFYDFYMTVCTVGDGNSPFTAWFGRQEEIHGDATDRYEYNMEEIRQDWVSSSYGEKISLPHDAQKWTSINGHPLVTLMRLIVWNSKTTCTPLQNMADWEEFFDIYDDRFVGRALSMLQVAMQFPKAYFNETKKVDPAGGNSILNIFYSPSFISSEIVLANEALVRHDREIFLQRPTHLQKYSLTVLTILAPYQDCAKPNFGRVSERKERQENIKHRGLHNTKQGSEGGRMATKKKQKMMALKEITVDMNTGKGASSNRTRLGLVSGVNDDDEDENVQDDQGENGLQDGEDGENQEENPWGKGDEGNNGDVEEDQEQPNNDDDDDDDDDNSRGVGGKERGSKKRLRGIIDNDEDENEEEQGEAGVKISGVVTCEEEEEEEPESPEKKKGNKGGRGKGKSPLKGMAKGKDSGKVVPTSSSTGGTKGKGRNGR